MRRTIFTKVFGVQLIIIVLLSFLIVFFSFRTIRTHHINTIAGELHDLAVGLRPRIVSFFEGERWDALDSLVKEMGTELDTRITVIDPNGIVLADSEKDPRDMELHRDRPEFIQAMKDDRGRSLRFSETVQENMLYVAVPVTMGSDPVAVLRTSLYLSDIENLLGSLRGEIIILAAVMTVLSLLGALIFSRSLSQPIRQLERGARTVGEGNFNVRVLLKSKDELRELADSFNLMTEKIRTLFEDLSLQKEELNGIVTSIQEGLLVLDREGRIKRSNQSFRDIVDGEAPVGDFYWEVLREPGLIELVKRVAEERKNRIDEVRIGNRCFLCSITFIPNKEEIVIVLHDITEIRNLEQVKKDFVANVSHELRTPLTAIQGFVETLEEEVNEDQKRYLEVIRRHTDRLANIVGDLAVLSELEEPRGTVEFEEVDLLRVAEDVLTIFRPKIESKGLSLKYKIEKPLPHLMGDSFRLEQLLINLLDNAVKYTEKGEIRLTLSKADRGVRIEVRDTGIGIPEEDKGRIFERFYVVDKSRSKRMGGTGLGLSIVKHIVLLHNGEIKVESRPGAGTTFMVLLPAQSA
jgi:two-component system phosphate regulon sensor histidine kinase PhoR